MTNRLDDKISAFVLELVDDPPPAPDIDLEAARRSALQPLQEAPQRRRAPIPVVVGAALLVLIAIGIPVLLFSGGQEVIDEPTTTLAPTTTAPTTTTVPPSSLNLPDTWQRVGAQVMTPVVGIFDMVDTSFGLVAVGFDPGEEDSRQNGVILASADGVEWTRLAEDDPALNMGGVLMYGITEGGPGLVAVGQGCEDDVEICMAYPTVWTSVDGTSWDRSPANPDVFGDRAGLLDVVATEHGLITAGGLYTADGEAELVAPTVWLSSDGFVWERVWQGEAYDYSTATNITGFQALTTDTNGRVVGVGTAINDEGEFVGAIWTSTDGRTWERIDQDSEVFASNTDSDVSILDVASGPGGFVAVGSDGGTKVAIWHSPDGLTWARANTADQPFEYIGSLAAVDALGTGWVIAGPHGFADITGGTATLWTSPDGMTWDRVHSFAPGYAMSIVATDSGIAVAGAIAGVDNYYASVWAGPSFDPLAPPPDPGLAPPPAEDNTPTIAEEGLSCEELVDLGYGYEQVVSYWMWYEQPTDLDRDGLGMPCTYVFPAEDVEAIFGASEAWAVEIVTDTNADIFSANGPAVDAGAICTSGTIRYRGESAPHPAAIWRWADLYTCDDGTGTFHFVGDTFFHEDGGFTAGSWSVDSGTDGYVGLTGGGGIRLTYVPDGAVIIGRLWLTDDEN